MGKNFFLFRSGNSTLFIDSTLREKLRKKGLSKTSNPFLADIIICRNLQVAKTAASLFPFKKVVVYQPELYVDTTKAKDVYLFGLKRIIIINGFNRSIYFNNYHFLSSAHPEDERDLGLKKGELISESNILKENEYKHAKPIVFIGQKRAYKDINKTNLREGIDLNLVRQEIAQIGFNKGVCDVIGRGWGQVSKIDSSGFDSGNESWWDTKLDILKDYRFNIALENTLWKYYVTEKIWHAIKAGCLPIYWGKDSSIYETFPKESFIDASEFKSYNDLINYTIKLPYALWYDRMKKCITVYNDSILKMTYSKCDEAIDRFLERIQ